MINAWSLLYEELNGTMAKTYPIKENTMSPCKIEDIKITSLESDEYDPIITVGSGNTASDGGQNYYVDTSNFDNISIDTSFLNNDHLTISGGDYDISGVDFTVPPYEEPICTANLDDITFYDDTWPHGSEIKIDMSNYVAAPGIETDNPRKYKEDESIKALQDYISTTYGGHYTSKENNVQTLDLIESVGDAESFCRSNAIKYLSRYDKKGQAKRDILKALHYTLLLYHFSGQLKDTITRGYETF